MRPEVIAWMFLGAMLAFAALAAAYGWYEWKQEREEEAREQRIRDKFSHPVIMQHGRRKI